MTEASVSEEMYTRAEKGVQGLSLIEELPKKNTKEPPTDLKKKERSCDCCGLFTTNCFVGWIEKASAGSVFYYRCAELCTK